VSLSLFDFLADGLKIKETPWHKLGLLVLTFVPPILFTVFYPRGFILALTYAGVFVAILLAIFPAMMVWNGRYRLKIAEGYRAKGGKIALILVILFSLLVIYVQLILPYSS